MKIEYWSDYACPACFIGHLSLHKAIEELELKNEVVLDMKAFELQPDAPKVPTDDIVHTLSKKHGIPLVIAKAEVESVSRQGRALGADMKLATAPNTNTHDAHRLTKYAYSVGKRDLVNLIYDAYYVKNEPLADHDVLLRLAKEAGLDTDEAAKVLDSDAFESDVRKDQETARRMGISGVPYYIIDGQITIPGSVSVEQFKKALTEAIDLEFQQNEGTMTCGPDGCRIR